MEKRIFCRIEHCHQCFLHLENSHEEKDFQHHFQAIREDLERAIPNISVQRNPPHYQPRTNSFEIHYNSVYVFSRLRQLTFPRVEEVTNIFLVLQKHSESHLRLKYHLQKKQCSTLYEYLQQNRCDPSKKILHMSEILRIVESLINPKLDTTTLTKTTKKLEKKICFKSARNIRSKKLKNEEIRATTGDTINSGKPRSLIKHSGFLQKDIIPSTLEHRHSRIGLDPKVDQLTKLFFQDCALNFLRNRNYLNAKDDQDKNDEDSDEEFQVDINLAELTDSETSSNGDKKLLKSRPSTQRKTKKRENCLLLSKEKGSSSSFEQKKWKMLESERKAEIKEQKEDNHSIDGQIEQKQQKQEGSKEWSSQISSCSSLEYGVPYNKHGKKLKNKQPSYKSIADKKSIKVLEPENYNQNNHTIIGLEGQGSELEKDADDFETKVEEQAQLLFSEDEISKINLLHTESPITVIPGITGDLERISLKNKGQYLEHLIMSLNFLATSFPEIIMRAFVKPLNPSSPYIDMILYDLKTNLLKKVVVRAEFFVHTDKVKTGANLYLGLTKSKGQGWAALIQKGLAKLLGSYEALKTLNCADFLKCLSGCPSLSIHSQDESKIEKLDIEGSFKGDQTIVKVLANNTKDSDVLTPAKVIKKITDWEQTQGIECSRLKFSAHQSSLYSEFVRQFNQITLWFYNPHYHFSQTKLTNFVRTTEPYCVVELIVSPYARSKGNHMFVCFNSEEKDQQETKIIITRPQASQAEVNSKDFVGHIKKKGNFFFEFSIDEGNYICKISRKVWKDCTYSLVTYCSSRAQIKEIVRQKDQQRQ